MSKAAWGDIIIDQSRLRDERPLPRSWKNIPIAEPALIRTDGLRWVAVRTAIKAERRVAAELQSCGYAAYCPLGAKFVFWQDGKRSKHKLVQQFPVFMRYIFVGLRAGQAFGKYIVSGRTMVLAEKIESVLSDSQGPLLIPSLAIRAVNEAEMSLQWDDTKRSPFRPGVEVRILRGPLSGFHATVDAATSEGRIRALLTMFGTSTIATLDGLDVAVV